jgi:[ribosomal protein S5]-alanine N-acetyltransferase
MESMLSVAASPLNARTLGGRSSMNPRVRLDSPDSRDAVSLASLARASRHLHRPWIYLPEDPRGWDPYLRRCRSGEIAGYLLRDVVTSELLGVVNIGQIVRGLFQSAYLGFYVHAAHARSGVMTSGLRAALKTAFTEHRLHRLEANIQPGNQASLGLVERLGFRREGFSPRYLKIGGRWRDHERWAITREDWRPRRRPTSR